MRPTDDRASGTIAPGGPLVSVIIPAWRAEDHIAAAVRSALDQSLDDLEVLVVDDASPDRTAAVVERLALLDPRVRLVRGGWNRGPAGARNLGLAAARGAWIALLDADDAYEPGRLETLVNFARVADADMVADNLLLEEGGDGDGDRGGGDGRPVIQPMIPAALLPAPQVVDTARFLEGNLPVRDHPRVSYGFLKPVFRRSFLARHGLRYDEGARFAEDFLFYTSALLAGARFWLLPQALYRYRVRGDSLTAAHDAGDLHRLLTAAAPLYQNPQVRQDKRLRAAVARHRRSIERRLAWRLFTDALKAGRPGAALAAAAGPSQAWHIAGECLRALPRVLARLRAGGGVVPRPVPSADSPGIPAPRG
ncbi:MAG: hypothetical protein RLY86_1235 [Pseudomonadota bacterium]|jgi:succinoglycan biosynthesis protein ExoO/succinoglycan biosynthesis protein ExoU